MATGDMPFRATGVYAESEMISKMIQAIKKDPTPKLPETYRCFDNLLGRFEDKK